MTKCIPAILRNLLIITYKDMVLLQKGQPKKVHWANIYNALGGHVDPYEDIYNSATRELYEESGIKLTKKEIKLRALIHVKTYFNDAALMLVFHAKVTNMNFIDSDEGKLEWVPINNVPTMNNIAPDLKFLIPKITSLKESELYTGTSAYNTKRELIKFNVYKVMI